MAKQDSYPGLEAGNQTLELKQQDVAQLLKKKQVADKAQEQAPAGEPEMVAAADSVFASDASPMLLAAAGDSDGMGGGGGLSAGAMIGLGVAAVGATILIIEATDDDDDAAPGGDGGPTPPPDDGGKNIELTAGQDDVGNNVTDEDFQISANGTDIVHGVVDPLSIFVNDQTFSVGDVIHGNGKTIVRLDVASAGFADVVEMADIATVELINNGASVTFFAGSWTNVGEVAMVGGPGGGVLLTDAAVGIDMSIAANVGNVGAAIAASYTNNLVAGVANSGKGGGSMVHDANNVLDLTVNVASLNSGSMFFANIAPGPVTVGDMTGVAGNSAFLFAGAVGLAPGDVTVGDIDLTLGNSGSASVFLGISGDLVVGDVSVAMGNSSTAGVFLGASGDLSFGDVDVSIGDNAGVTSTSIIGAFFTATGTLTGGNISLAVGDAVLSGSVAISAGVFASDDINVGDISLSVGDITHTDTGAQFVNVLNVFGSNDVTVGDVSLAAGNYSETSFFPTVSGTGYQVFNAAGGFSAAGGNTTVGNISIVGGDNNSAVAIVHMGASYSFTNATVGGTVTFSRTGAANSGTAMSVGDVTMSVGDVLPTTAGAFGPSFVGLDLFIANTSALAGGSVTVGDVNLSAGLTSTVSGFIWLWGQGGTGQAGDLGDLMVGDVAIDIGQNGFGFFSVYQSQFASTSVDHSLGALTVGDIVVTLGQDASLTLAITQTLDGAAVAATMGDFTVGNVTANLDLNAFFSYDIDVKNDASYTAGASVGTVGAVTIGDVIATVDDGATLSIEYDITGGTGTTELSNVGSVTIGDLDVTLGVAATLGSYSIDIRGHDVGAVIIGDIQVFVGQNSDVSSISIDVDATRGTDGNLASFTLGNVALTLDVGATLSTFSIDLDADGNIGDVTVGDVSLLVNSGTDTVNMYYTVSAGLNLGNFTMGDVSIVAVGPGTDTLSVSVNLWATAGTIGDISIGNVLLSYTENNTGLLQFTLNQAAAAAAGSGDVTIAGITLDYTAVGTATTAALTDYYDIGVFAGGGDLHIALVDVDIKISSTNVASATTEITTHLNLTQILTSVTSTAAAGVTLGTVDYSDVVYAGTLVNPTFTIDVSAYGGDITIIGSVLNDIIIGNDNAGDVITMTGGAGNDVFDFKTGNGSIAQAGSGKVTDFEHAGVVELIAVDGPTVTINEFGTGSYASFAAFLADADARFGDLSPEDAIIGQVGTSVFLIVDANTNNNADAGDILIEIEGASVNTLDFGDFLFY